MKTKLKIIIPATIAVAAIIIAVLLLQFTPASKNETSDIAGMLSTAQKYLSEHNYEQAVLEFEKVISLEPKNVEAYIGIAEAYIALGNTDKAIEWLEKGYELTGDERLKQMLDELLTFSEIEETTTLTLRNTIPNIIGMSLEEAEKKCNELDLKYKVIEIESETVDEGIIIEQSIPYDADFDDDTILMITVSTGVPKFYEKREDYADGRYSIYMYDSEKNIISVDYFDNNDDCVVHADYLYGDGKIIRKINDEEDEVEFSNMDEKNREWRMQRANTTDGPDEYRWTYIYDENGEYKEYMNDRNDFEEHSYLEGGVIVRSISWNGGTEYFNPKLISAGVYDTEFKRYSSYPVKDDSGSYTYDYDNYGAPVTQYKNGVLSEQYLNYYNEQNDLAYVVHKGTSYKIGNTTTTTSHSFCGTECDSQNNVIRDVVGYAWIGFESIYIPNYDGTQRIDSIFIDNYKCTCRYCRGEE